MNLLLVIIGLMINVKGKTIEIRIDSDDLLVFINKYLNSKATKNPYDMILRKSIDEIKYRNPYHPEDEETNGGKIPFKIKPGSKFDNFAEDFLEDSIEKQNANFIAHKDEASEDVLTDNEQKSPETSLKFQPFKRRNDMNKNKSTFSYKSIKRRFEVKNSTPKVTVNVLKFLSFNKTEKQ